MSEVIYYVAPPFVFTGGGVAGSEIAECLSANAAMRAEALSATPGPSRSPGPETRPAVTSAKPS